MVGQLGPGEVGKHFGRKKLGRVELIAGGDLVMLINQTKVTDIETKTIDDMAAMIGNGNSVVKIIISRVLGEIGPTAN